jgi:CDP-diacylglycerol--glycerol-3-phosphate 3-phosphatidyltransferase/CDP-diacylglycerol--inositol 3-phosphatidyltransferase
MHERFRQFWTNDRAPQGDLPSRMGESPNAVTLVGPSGVCAGALVCFPQGWLLAGGAVVIHGIRVQRHDRRLHGPHQRFSSRRSGTPSTTPRSTGSADAAIFGGLARNYSSPRRRSEWRAGLAIYCLPWGR